MTTTDDAAKRGRRAQGSGDGRAGTGSVSPLVARLDRIAKRIARGRIFEDSTPAIRAAREGRRSTE